MQIWTLCQSISFACMLTTVPLQSYIGASVKDTSSSTIGKLHAVLRFHFDDRLLDLNISLGVGVGGGGGVGTGCPTTNKR